MRVRRFARLEVTSVARVASQSCRRRDRAALSDGKQNVCTSGGILAVVRRARKEVTAESLRLRQGVRRVREFWGRDEGAPVDYVAHVPRESSCLSALPLRSAAEINHSRTERIVRESSGQGATDFEPSIRRHNTSRAIIGNHR